MSISESAPSQPPGVPALSRLACPICGRALIPGKRQLRCAADGATFPLHSSGLLDLRAPDARQEAESFANQYAADRRAEGWKPLTPEAACALPFGNPPGFTRLYWAVRRESWRALAALLAELGHPPLWIADLGAGVPWLSHRLASLGHRVVAVDLSPDPDFGLGAARLYPTAARLGDDAAASLQGPLEPGGFLPLLGDLTRPPLSRHAYDVIICNASLHYAASLDGTVTRLAEALAPSGALIIMDSPVAATPRPGERQGRRVLGCAQIEDALVSAGLAVRWLPVRRGWLWHWHQIRTRLLARTTFAFPIAVGRRSGGSSRSAQG